MDNPIHTQTLTNFQDFFKVNKNTGTWCLKIDQNCNFNIAKIYEEEAVVHITKYTQVKDIGTFLS